MRCLPGPDSWWIHYPSAGGHHQSPIDIDPEEAEFDSDLAAYPLNIHYENSSNMYLQNTGHSVQVDMRNARSCKYYSTLPSTC